LATKSLDELLKIAPVVNEQTDLRALRLTSQEGFLLSQIDGMTPAAILCDLVALDPTVLVIALQRLEKLGAVRWALRHADPGRGRREAAEDSAAQRDIAHTSAADPALEEECDLSRDERLQILKAERDFPTRSHWEILGLSGDPSPSEIKRAYFAASKSFHPDRYFGRKLGSFTDRLERIFFLLKRAYDTLSNEEKRRAYRVRHPPPARVAPAAAGEPTAASETPAEKEARLEARRRQIVEERKQRRRAKFAQPERAASAGKSRQAEEMHLAGISQLRAGDVYAAVASFKLAMTYEPDNGQYRSMFEEANAQAMLARAVEVAGQAETAANTGASAEAARLYTRAFEMTPNKSEYAVKAAELLLQLNDLDQALQLANQAVEAAPRRAQPRLILAMVLEATGDRRAAVEHLRAAESLDPDDAHVKTNLRRLAR
jgi:tetratricopeptide (TPR) repeat protein